MTTAFNANQGAQSGEADTAATATAGQGTAQGFRQPESVAPGVTPGHILESNEPNLSLIHI